MADCLDTGCLSFFTANHSRHDKQWLQKGSQLTLVCFACFVEIIENKNEPSIRKTRILKELLSLISAGDILNTLAVNDSVVSHLLNCLWELSDSFDENNASGSIAVVEIIYQLCCSLRSEALVAKVIEYLSEKLFSSENIKMVSPQLDLLGKLLQKIPGLTKNVVQHQQKLMAYIAKSIAFPDEGIRSSLFFVLTHLYRDKDCCSAIPASTTEGILRECCEVLTSATSKELQINSTALLQSLTRPENLPKRSLGSNMERVITSLKKAFLSKEDLVKSLAIGCLDNLVLYDEKIVDSDLTGFLFEVFKTKSEALLALGFQCVAQMVEKKALYTKGHVLYGFETIVSALMVACANKNSKLVKQGFSVLAKILGNCPAELSLISSNKIFLQCSDVLNRGLYTLDDAVFFHASRCFCSFLERRHFTCEMPYGRLMALIEPLVERLGKICTSAAQWNHAEDKDLVKSSIIDTILEVIKKSLDLATCGKNDLPTLEALLVSQEENNRKELENFVNKLLQLCDQVCIPNVVANLKKFYGTTVPEKFFEILNKLLCTCPVESLNEMCEKFASSYFIRIALDIKAYYLGKSPSATLRASVNTFLEIMCSRLSLPDMQQRLKFIFNSSVQHVNGTAQELLQVLMQKYSGDEALKETQECILVIFHLAYKHGDRLVTTSQLLHALSNFLVLNPTCFDNPSQAIIPSCLTWLFITELHHHADRVDDSGLLHKAQQILAEGISKYVNNLEVVYFHDFALVEWVLEMQDLNPALRKGILELYFSHRAETDLTTGKIEIWKKMVEKHPATLLFLASILGTGEVHAQNAILNVLPHVLNTCPTQSQAFQNITKELKNTFQNLFLNQAVEPLPDQNISSILKLLCLLITFSPKGPLDDFLKLIYHVVNLLTRPGNSEKLSTECLNFLNASIVHEANSRSDQVLGFLLKHYGFNKFLESVIDSFHSRMDLGSLPEHTTLAAVLVSVSHLLRFQKIFAITTECQLEINLEVVLSLLSYTSSPLLLFTANIIWASILQDDPSNSKVSLTSKTLLGTRNSRQKLSKVNLRIILIRLQNSILHGNPLVQMSALKCLEALLSSGKDVKSLIQDPWNRVMLREVKDLTGSVTLLALQLYSLFLYQQRTKGWSLDLPVTDLLQVALERFIEWENPTDPKWLSAYARFFLEVIQSSSHPMSSLQKSNLRCHVEHLMESDPEDEVSMKINHCDFSYVQTVLIHDEIIHGKTNDPFETLKGLLDLLK